MHPIVSDPHNHVPEVSSDDQWGDAEESPLFAYRPSTILPPRRPPTEEPSPQATGNQQDGLRIESTPQARQPDEEAKQLDIHEIDGSVVRLDPEEPSQPRMPRQAVPLQPAFRKPKGAESGEWGNTRKMSMRWMIGIGLAVPSVVIAALMLLPLINRSNATGYRPGQVDLALDTSDAIEDAAVIEQLLNLQSEAALLYKKFMTAATADDLSTMVKDPVHIIPLIHSKPRPVLISKRWSPEGNAKWNVLISNSKPFGRLHGHLPDYSEFSAYFVLSDDQLRIDWKATTGYGTATFDELTHSQGDPSEIRGTIKPTDYYSPVFPEAEFQSYQLFSPDGTTAIWCYTYRQIPTADTIDKLFHGGDILKTKIKPQRITLRLEHGPDGALPNQWLIGEMLHEEWISP